MVKGAKRRHDVISTDKKPATATESQTQAESGNCSGCCSTDSGQIHTNAAVNLQFGFQGSSFGIGLQAMMQDPFLTAFTDMTAENSFAPSWPSSTSRSMSMTLTANWGSNVPKSFEMPNIPYGLLDRSTLPSVTSNGLFASSPYDAQNHLGMNFQSSWDTSDLVNNLLTVWPTGQEFSSRTEFERAMESAVSFGLPTVKQTLNANVNVTHSVKTKSDYTVVNNGFYSTTTDEDDGAGTDPYTGVAVEPLVVTDESDNDADADSDADDKETKSSQMSHENSKNRKRKNCESGKCPLSRDGRRRSRRSRSSSGRNRRSKSAKQSGGRRRVSRRSKSVQSRRRRSSRKSTAGKRRSRR